MTTTYHGRRNVIKLLLEMQDNIDTQDGPHGPLYIALHAAILGGHQDCVKDLLNGGARVDTQGRYLGSPLYVATSRSKIGILETLMANGVRKDYACNALQMAALHSHHLSVELLVAAGADINSNIDSDIGMNPLHAIIFQDHKIVVQILLERGALIAMDIEANRCALHVAITMKYILVEDITFPFDPEIETKNFVQGT